MRQRLQTRSAQNATNGHDAPTVSVGTSAHTFTLMGALNPCGSGHPATTGNDALRPYFWGDAW
jgi:hypothetical protein